jgi:hypothetical protein
MATFKITHDNSVAVGGFVEFAFADDTAQADSLTVDAGGFLISQGALSIGAFLASTLGWKVTVNGSVTSVDHAGIYLDSNNTAASTITIGADGVVGGRYGLYVGSTATIKNSGVVSARSSASASSIPARRRSPTATRFPANSSPFSTKPASAPTR